MSENLVSSQSAELNGSDLKRDDDIVSGNIEAAQSQQITAADPEKLAGNITKKAREMFTPKPDNETPDSPEPEPKPELEPEIENTSPVLSSDIAAELDELDKLTVEVEADPIDLPSPVEVAPPIDEVEESASEEVPVPEIVEEHTEDAETIPESSAADMDEEVYIVDDEKSDKMLDKDKTSVDAESFPNTAESSFITNEESRAKLTDQIDVAGELDYLDQYAGKVGELKNVIEKEAA